MDVYVESARDVLTNIVQGRTQYESRLAAIQADIRSKLDRPERLVICGMSPVGRIAKNRLAAYGKPIEVLDLRGDSSRQTIEHVTRTDVQGGGHSVCDLQPRGCCQVFRTGA